MSESDKDRNWSEDGMEYGKRGLSSNVEAGSSDKRLASVFLEKLEFVTITTSALLLLSGMTFGLIYFMNNDKEIRQSVYLWSGTIFWMDFYFFVAASAVLIFLFFDLERRVRSSMFHSADKLKLIRRYYLSSESTAVGRLSTGLCATFIVLVFGSAGLGIGLAVSKVFLMR